MAEALERNVQNLQELEEKFDPEMRFRPTLPPATVIVKWLLIILSGFHFYTAGFGLLRDHPPGRAPGLCAGVDFFGVCGDHVRCQQHRVQKPPEHWRGTADRLVAGSGLRGQCHVHPICV